jgi:NADH-quinone oxidoreductase subunit N
MFDNFVVPDLLPAAPELFLAFMALVILLVDLLVKDSGARYLRPDPADPARLRRDPVFTSTGEVVYTFSNMFVDDLMADLLKMFLYMTVIVVLFYSRGYCSTASR